MPLAFSNMVSSSPLASALKSKMAPVSPLGIGGFKQTVSPFGIGKTAAPSSPNMSVASPEQLASFQAPAPVSPAKPAAAPAISASSPAGSSYKGTAITPGSDADVAAQVARIDAQGNTQQAPVQAPQSAPQAPTQPATPTYAGLVGNLVSNAQNTAQQGQMTPEELAARQKLAGIPGVLGAANAQIESTPSENAVQMGREAVAGRNVEAQRQSLAGQVDAYAAERAANVSANSAAGNQYGTAVAAGKPTVESYGETTFNPLTGTFDGGGNLDPQTQATSLAQKVISRQMTYDQAAQSLGYAGSVGSNFLNNAITSAGENPLQLQASGSATQGVIGTQTATQAGYQSALQQGQNLQSQLKDLITTFGLNPADLNKANQGLQTIARNVSDPHYKQLENYVNDIANTYAQVLTPPGGSATDTSRGIASSMLDATAKGTSLIDTMKSLDNAAQAKIAGVSTTGGSHSSGGATVQTKAGPVNTSW